jgi:hypothetical protein
MLNVKASPSGSEAPGVNEYELPAITAEAGFPEIDGALFVGGGLLTEGWSRFSLLPPKHPANETSNAEAKRIATNLQSNFILSPDRQWYPILVGNTHQTGGQRPTVIN